MIISLIFLCFFIWVLSPDFDSCYWPPRDILGSPGIFRALWYLGYFSPSHTLFFDLPTPTYSLYLIS